MQVRTVSQYLTRVEYHVNLDYQWGLWRRVHPERRHALRLLTDRLIETHAETLEEPLDAEDELTRWCRNVRSASHWIYIEYTPAGLDVNRRSVEVKLDASACGEMVQALGALPAAPEAGKDGRGDKGWPRTLRSSLRGCQRLSSRSSVTPRSLRRPVSNGASTNHWR